jgi:hypothetical protein
VLVRTHWRADHRKKESRIFEGKSGFAHLALLIWLCSSGFAHLA